MVWEFPWYNCSAVCGLSAQRLCGGANGDLLQEGLCHRLCGPGSCTQSPRPCGRPLMTHASTGDSNTGLAQSLWGVWVLVCTRLFEPSKCLWQVWGLILNAIPPLLPSCRGLSFALGHGVSFFGGIQHSPVDGCSSVSCNFAVLTGEDVCLSFYSAI